MKFRFTYGKLYLEVEKFENILVRTLDLLSTSAILYMVFSCFGFFKWAVDNRNVLIITDLVHVFYYFVHFRYNLDKTRTMKFELLITFYVSFLNSFEIERRGSDRIFGVTDEQCEDAFFGKKKKKICACYKGNSTLLSGKNDQYKCNNEEYLGTLF